MGIVDYYPFQNVKKIKTLNNFIKVQHQKMVIQDIAKIVETNIKEIKEVA